MAVELNIREIEVPNAPEIEGLRFRHFAGEADFAEIVKVIHGCKQVDGVERVETVEDVTRDYQNLTNCNLDRDMIFIEMHGEVIGYGRCTWWTEEDGDRYAYLGFGYILPAYRGEGIGRAVLAYQEDHLREIAREHPADAEKVIDAWAAETETDKQRLLEAAGYKPERTTADMVRALKVRIPDPPLPDGLEVRTGTDEDWRRVWEHDTEAFRGQWGFTERTEADYRAFREDPRWDPELWQIAWDGDEIAGQVLCYIREEENEEYNRKRGYTEWISTRRDWRGQGVATHLICRGMRALKARGMEEAALGVHTENTTGAFELYQKLGFEVERQSAIYRKPLETT